MYRRRFIAKERYWRKKNKKAVCAAETAELRAHAVDVINFDLRRYMNVHRIFAMITKYTIILCFRRRRRYSTADRSAVDAKKHTIFFLQPTRKLLRVLCELCYCLKPGFFFYFVSLCKEVRFPKTCIRFRQKVYSRHSNFWSLSI
jgi:hypothetical protein